MELAARKYVIELHNSNDDLVAVLENAYGISYREAINEAPTLSFKLPADDTKATNIIKANEIWLRKYEDGSLVNRFRLTRKSDIREATLVITVNADGLINQLAEELIIDYSADTLTITQIVTALLNLQVLTPEITVGTIDPVVSRSIGIDNDILLRSLYRLRDTVGGHIYVDNSRALQWKTSIGEDVGQQIRYKKNLKGITREIDYTTLANKIYAYGAGEGDARIKLSDAEGHAVDYVEDAGEGSSQDRWGGIYIKVIVDRRITHPDTLLAWANLRLADLKEPRITYQIDTVDLSASDEIDFSFEVLQIGSTITVIDEDLSIDISAQVVKITHPDLLHPELMEIEVANRSKDITDILSEVYDRQQFDQHIATKIGAGQVVVKGAFTVLDWVTGGETTIVGSHIETGTVELNRLDFVPLTSSGLTGEVIATINATAEGIKISASKIEITAGINIFKQPGIPTSEIVGDLWFDTDDDNKLYRAACVGADAITEGEWESVQDVGIAANAAAIVVTENNISLNVTAIEANEGNITTNTGNITVNADNISLNVTNISSIDGRVTTAEGSIDVNAYNILLKVSTTDYEGVTICSKINLTSSAVTIDAKHININGECHFTAGYDPTTKLGDGEAAADINAYETTINGGKITTNSIAVNTLMASTLTSKIITLGAGGKFATGASPNPRIEITDTLIVGYSDDTTEQFYLQASDGKAYCGAGSVILDADGIKITGETLAFYYGATRIGTVYYNATFDSLDVKSYASKDIRLWSDAQIKLRSDLSTTIGSASGYGIRIQAGDVTPSTPAVNDLELVAADDVGLIAADNIVAIADGFIRLTPGVGETVDITGSGDLWADDDIDCGGVKDATVITKDGRRLIFSAIESSEIWFEEKLSGILDNGIKEIILDERFLASTVIDASHPLHVIITPLSRMAELWVEKRNNGVIVHGNGNAKFDITISAKRLHYEDRHFDKWLHDADLDKWYKESKAERFFSLKPARLLYKQNKEHATQELASKVGQFEKKGD